MGEIREASGCLGHFAGLQTTRAHSSICEPLPTLLTVVAFVGLWIVGLVLIGVVCGWRAAVWTVAEVRRGGDVRGVH